MKYLDRPSFALGVCVVVFLWMGSNVLTAEDTTAPIFTVHLVFTVAAGVQAVFNARTIRRRDGTIPAAHIDTEGVYAALRCTGCNAHLVYIEHGHDLVRLASARGRHECAHSRLDGDGAS